MNDLTVENEMMILRHMNRILDQYALNAETLRTTIQGNGEY